MAQAINVPVNVQAQNTRQLTQQIQASLNSVRLNLGNGRALSSLSQPLGRLTGQADEFSKSLDAANARVLAFGASVGVVNAFSNAFKNLVASTIEVEKAIKAITVVGDQFNGKTKELTQGLFNVAKTTGQSFAEVSKAALEFSRQGLGVEQTLQRTKDALILTRLTGLDAAKAVEGLTAAANGFTKAGLSTTQILNKLAAVDQAFAVSSADLIEGFNRSAAVAENAGVTFDELAGIITALQQKTSRGGAVIGNALKTIFTRLQDTNTLNQLEGLGIAVEDLQNNILPARQILQNLAKDVQGLGKITKAGIFKDVAGTFQINQLISLVEDLNNENSVAANATKKAAGATNEAFVANEKLNQSLDAIINKVALTGKQLGSLIGELGLSDSFKGILDGINSFLEGATNLLQGDDLGSKFAKGIVKGIGAVLTGPGLGIFLAVIGKLTLDLVKFGTQSIKTFFGIGQAAKQQQQVQESIVQTLLRNENVLRSILNTQGGQNAQAQTFLTILNQQEQALQNIRSLAGGIAAPIIAGGYGVGPQGGIQRRGRAAGGYLPAQEASDVRRGVGGASPSSKVVAIPNFAFGGGKRGTMIANTSEYIVPNYAGGGSAIFNQDMVKTMGLPAGAKKISAAGGFVPNFALVSEISKRNPRVKINLNKSSSSDNRLSPNDIVNLKGNKFQQIIEQKLPNESEFKYEDRLIKKFGYLPNDSLKYAGSSAVDGFKIKGNNIDLLEVKSGNWNSLDVLNKFLRVLPENYGTNNSLDLWSKKRDVFSVNASLASPIRKQFKSSQGKLFKRGSGGYIPNFAFTNDQLGVLGLYGPNTPINGSQVYTFESNRPEFYKDIKSGYEKRVTGFVNSYAKQIAKKIGGGFQVSPKAVIKSLDQSRNISGFIFEDVMNQLAGPNFDTNRVSGNVRIDFPMTSNLREVFGVTGVERFAEVKLTPQEQVSSIIEKQKALAKALATGGYAPKETDQKLIEELRKEAIEIEFGKGGRPKIELRDKKKAFIQKMRSSGLLTQTYLGQGADETNAIKKALGLASTGYIPNFAASALQQAIAREKNAGLSSSQIYVDQSSALKSPSNPMGLMVANTRDEPAGGFQGIARARREGANPKLYGAANGFVPNYAVAAGGGVSTANLQKFNTELSRLIQEIQNGTKTFDVADKELKAFAQTLQTSKGNKIRSSQQNYLITQGTQELQNAAQPQQPTEAPKGFADLAGKIVVAQTALSFFQAAATEAGGETERLANVVSTTIATFAQLGFLLSGTKFGDKIFGYFRSVFSKIGNNLGKLIPGGGGSGGIGAGVRGFAGRVAGAAGPIALAGFAISQAAGVIKEFDRGDVSKSLEALSESADKAAASLTDSTRATLIDAQKQAKEDILSGRNILTGILEGISFGQADITNRGGVSFNDTRLIDEEFEKVYNQILTSFVATGLDAQNAIKETNKLLIGSSFGPNKSKTIVGGVRTQTNLTDKEEQKRIKTQLELNAIQAQSAKTQEEFALAQATSAKRTDETVKSLNLNKAVVEALRVQYVKLRDSILKVDIDAAFQKFANKTLVDLNTGLSAGQRSVEELNNSIKEIEIDFRVEKAKNLSSELEKINLDIQKALEGVGATLNNPEQFDAIKKLQEAVVTGDVDALPDITKNLAGLNEVNLISLRETALQFKRQNEELDRQTKLKIGQARLDFAAKTLADQQTLAIEKQTKAIEKQVQTLEKTFDLNRELVSVRREIEDTKFERSLIGLSDRARTSREISRQPTLRQREQEDVVADFRKTMAGEVNAIISELPDTLSFATKQALRQQALTAQKGILTGEVSGSPKQQIETLASASQININSLIEQINAAEKASSDAAFAEAKLTGDIFEASVQNSGDMFKNAVMEAGVILQTALIDAKIEELASNPNKENLNQINEFNKQKAKFSEPFKQAQEQAQQAALDRQTQLQTQQTTVQGQVEAAQKAYTKAVSEHGATSAKAGLALEQLNLAEQKSITATDALTQSLLEMGNATLILSNLVRNYIDGLPSELANLQFGALQATNPDDLVSKLIGQQAINETAGLTGEDRVKEIAGITALREKQYEIATAESATRRRELEYEEEYLKRFLKLKKEGATVEELAAERRRQIEEQRTFGRGFERGLDGVQDSIDNYRSELGQEIPRLFSQNLAQGLNDAISGAKSLKDALRDAATSFLNAITQKNIENLANIFTVGGGKAAKNIFGFASGGMIKGGSGTKDDVPAMLMGGEYVIKKSAVKKYGSKFLDSLNNGGIKAFAKGGGVQSGRGGFYVPGDYGEGAITGKNQLLAFAGQSFTGGQYEQVGVSGMSGASINLESESARLTAFGRENSPMFERVQQAKEEAFNVYLNQLKQEQQYREQLKQIEEAEKARKKQLTTAIVSAVATTALSAAGTAFKAGASNAVGSATAQAASKGATLGTLSKIGIGLKGGLGFGGVTGKGGLGNLFSGNFSSAFTNFSAMGKAAGAKPNYNFNSSGQYRGTTIGNSTYLAPNYLRGAKMSGGATPFPNVFTYGDYDFNRSTGSYQRRAFGGMISGGSGIRDDVPAMLTGGEFVLNNRATRKLGVENLNRLNSGDVGGNSGASGQQVSESIISKLDELIQTTRESSKENVVVNVSGMEASEKRADENKSATDRELQRKIRDAVLAVLAQEKRMGGSLSK